MKKFLLGLALVLGLTAPAYANWPPVNSALPGSSGDLLYNNAGSPGAKTVPSCADSSGQHLNFSGGTFSCGTSTGTPTLPGSSGDLLYNNGGALGARTVPSCADTSGQHLNFNAGTFSCGTSSSSSGLSGGTAGRVLFWQDATTLANDTNFFWDNSTKRLRVGHANSPSEPLDSGGAVVTRGIAVSTIASTGLLDYTGGQTRLISRGADTSTNGGFSLISTRSNGSNILTPFQTDSKGHYTFTQTVSQLSGSNRAGTYTVTNSGQRQGFTCATNPCGLPDFLNPNAQLAQYQISITDTSTDHANVNNGTFGFPIGFLVRHTLASGYTGSNGGGGALPIVGLLDVQSGASVNEGAGITGATLLRSGSLAPHAATLNYGANLYIARLSGASSDHLPIAALIESRNDVSTNKNVYGAVVLNQGSAMAGAGIYIKTSLTNASSGGQAWTDIMRAGPIGFDTPITDDNTVAGAIYRVSGTGEVYAQKYNILGAGTTVFFGPFTSNQRGMVLHADGTGIGCDFASSPATCGVGISSFANSLLVRTTETVAPRFSVSTSAVTGATTNFYLGFCEGDTTNRTLNFTGTCHTTPSGDTTAFGYSTTNQAMGGSILGQTVFVFNNISTATQTNMYLLYNGTLKNVEVGSGCGSGYSCLRVLN